MKKNFKSWKTTAAGILGGIGLLATQLGNLADNDPATLFDYKVALMALGMLGIGFFARDGDKSSEDVADK